MRSLGYEVPTRQVFALWPTSGLSPAAAAMLEVLKETASELRMQLRTWQQATPASAPAP